MVNTDHQGHGYWEDNYRLAKLEIDDLKSQLARVEAKASYRMDYIEHAEPAIGLARLYLGESRLDPKKAKQFLDEFCDWSDARSKETRNGEKP